MSRVRIAASVLSLGLLCAAWAVHTSVQAGAPVVVLEDFRSKDPDGFPTYWKGEGARSQEAARRAYKIQAEGEQAFLSARQADQRVHKKIAWDPRTHPILTWKWRLKAAPAGAEPIAAVFASLDTDLMVIPVSDKYVWSSAKPKGTMTEGGLFSASEIVVRAGAQPVGEWIEERVNAYEDFKKIHKHEPGVQAWGISVLAGPGVEVDFGSIAVSAE
jgi:hypothetical protein